MTYRLSDIRPRFSAARRASTLAFVVACAVVLGAPSALAADSLELIPDFRLFGLFGTGEGLGSLWIMILAFSALIFPLNALIFQPIFRALDERQERIEGARSRSAQLEASAGEVLTRYESAIREARSESEASRQTQLTSAREEQVHLTSQARSEAEQELERARGELSRSLEDARATLRASADDLATTAAEQILGRTLS